jgi:hypothetical protein
VIAFIVGLVMGLLLGTAGTVWAVVQCASWLNRRQVTVERHLQRADHQVSLDFWRARRAMEDARQVRNLAG